MVLQCNNGVGSNPVEGRTILTLFGLIFRRIYIYNNIYIVYIKERITIVFFQIFLLGFLFSFVSKNFVCVRKNSLC